MTPPILTALLAALILGLALLALGLRGRRLDRTPLCRACRFDLTGVVPDGKTCPECGSGLARPKAVRIGRRRRLWTVATLGALLAAAPILAAGVVGYSAATGSSLSKFMPVGLLLAQARHGNADAIADAGTELVSRLSAGSLTQSQQTRIIGAILDIQGNPDAPWEESLGDFIETARIAGGMDDESYQRFLNQAIVFGIETRPIVAVGDPIPVSVFKEQDRVGRGSGVHAQILIRQVRVNGEPLDWQRQMHPGRGAATSKVTRPPSYGFTAWGSAAGSGGNPTQRFSRLPDPPLSPGPHTLEIDYVVEGHLYIMGRSPAFGVDPDRQSAASLHLPLQVVPPQERDLTLIPATDEMNLRLLRDIGVSIRTGESNATTGEGAMTLTFDLTHLPAPLAHDVFVVFPDIELPIGTVQQLPADQLQSAASKRWSMQAGIGPGFVTPDSVGIILKPNIDLALDRSDMRELYNGELVFRSVPIERR